MAESLSPSWFTRLRPIVVTGAAAGLPLVGVMLLAWRGPAIAAWLEVMPAWQSIAIILLTGAVVCGAALMPTHAVSLAAGWLLGPVVGSGVAWAAVMLGALTCYSGGRVLAGPGLAAGLKASEKWSGLHAALVTASPGRTTSLVALLRLSPLAPFAATNVALAALGLSYRPFALGTAIGLTPRIVVVALLGAGMAQLDFSKPHAPALLILGIVATLAALVVIGRIAARALRERTQSRPAGSNAANA